MGLIKLGAVVFGAYVVGGRIGSFVLVKVSPNTGADKDSYTAAQWAGRAVAFVGFSYLASKL